MNKAESVVLGLISLGFVSIPLILFAGVCNLIPRVCLLPFPGVLQGKGDLGNKVKEEVEHLEKSDSIVLQKTSFRSWPSKGPVLPKIKTRYLILRSTIFK